MRLPRPPPPRRSRCATTSLFRALKARAAAQAVASGPRHRGEGPIGSLRGTHDGLRAGVRTRPGVPVRPGEDGTRRRGLPRQSRCS